MVLHQLVSIFEVPDEVNDCTVGLAHRLSQSPPELLMEDLGTLSLVEVTPPGSPEHRLHICAESTALQQRAFELLDVEPGRIVPSTATG